MQKEEEYHLRLSILLLCFEGTTAIVSAFEVLIVVATANVINNISATVKIIFIIFKVLRL